MMRVEYLPDGSDDCPLIRFYRYTCADVVHLRELCASLAEGRAEVVRLHEQAWIEPIDGLQMELRCSAGEGGGVWKEEGRNVFHMVHTREEWEEVVEIVRPFEEPIDGFNWLTDGTEVEVLISSDGLW